MKIVTPVYKKIRSFPRAFQSRFCAMRRGGACRAASALAADYVVIGAGSAGSVIAARLSEDAEKSVVLLEPGESDRWSSPTDLLLHMPTALALPMQLQRYNWMLNSEPEEALGSRRVSCPRGRGLGGSSSINGMVYVRGHALDFDRWHELGALGWDYQHVLPYFKKAENWAHGQGAADFTYRGQSGPLHVKNGDNPFGTPLFDAFIRAGEEAGYGVTKDYNAKRQEGFGPMAMTVHHSGPLRGTRCSASSAYLRPAKDRKNLTVKTKAHVRKILFETGKEVPRATGVEISQNGSGKVQRITARKEVILCAGAIHSPQLLQVSGVGDFNMLPMGAPRVLHAPGVGTNLQDHLELYFQQECLTQDSIAPSAGSALKKFLIGLEWMLTRSGPGSSNHFEAAAFVRSAAGIQEPNVQFHFLPMAVAYGSLEPTSETSTGHSFQIHVGTSLSKSRGYIRARTNDMQDAPMIKFNYMSHPSDWADMRAAIRIAREVISMPSMKPFAGREIMPGPECVSDESLDEYIRDNVESAYHPCGTCAMGTVLDAEGRVTGAEGLRVADASAFPHITNGNLNAPVIMLAERIADMIKGNVLPPHELAPEDAPWVAADWKLQDREKKANLAR